MKFLTHPPTLRTPGIAILPLLAAIAMSLSSSIHAAHAQIQTPWVAVGPTSATVYSLTRDPFNPSNMFAGTYFGGLYKTTNRGSSWSNVPAPFSTNTVFTIAMSTLNAGEIFVGTLGSGIYETKDGGLNWFAMNSGLTQLTVQAIAIQSGSPETLLASAGTHLFRSVDGGATWAQITTGLTGVVVRSLAIDPTSPDTAYVGAASGGVFRSLDGGLTWAQFSSGMRPVTIAAMNLGPNGTLYAASPDSYLYKLPHGATSWINITSNLVAETLYQILPHPTSTGVLFAAAQSGTFISANDGATWYRQRTTPTDVLASDDVGFVIYAADIDGALVASTNNGTSWFNAQQGMQNSFIGGIATTLASGSSTVYAGSDLGIWSEPGGTTNSWTLSPNYKLATFTVAVDPLEGGHLLAGTEKYGLWRSTDSGATWSSSSGLIPGQVYALAKSGGTAPVLYAGTTTGLYLSRDAGKHWQQATGVAIPSVQSVAVDPVLPQVAYVGSAAGGLYQTLDFGLTYTLLNSGLPPNQSITQIKVSPLYDNRVYAVASGGQLYLTDNSGTNWTQAQSNTNLTVVNVNVDPSEPWIVYMATAGSGVYRSDSAAAAWTQKISGLTNPYVFCVGIDPLTPGTIYAGTTTGVFVSTNRGETWTSGGTLPSGTVSHIVVSAATEGTVYAAIDGQGIFKSTNGGVAWASYSTNLATTGSLSLTDDPNTPAQLFAGTTGRGVFVSPDGVSPWQISNSGMSLFMRGIAFDPSTTGEVYSGALLGGFFRSTDGGATWTNTGLTNQSILDVKTGPNTTGTVYVASSQGIYKSVDSGTTFTLLGQKSSYVFSLAADPRNRNTIYLGGASGTLCRSLDGGLTWALIGASLPARNILALAVDPNSGAVYAAPDSSGIYKSSDGGNTWALTQNSVTASQQITHFTFNTALGVIYASSNKGGVFLSFDAGANWEQSNSGLAVLTVTSISEDPNASGTIYAVVPGTGVYRSTQGGGSWQLSSLPATAGATVVQADLNTAHTVWVGTTKGLYKSTDSGTTWTALSGAIATQSIVDVMLDVYQPGVLYAATLSAALYKSSDGGSTWTLLPTNISGSQAYALAEGPNAQTILIGTLGAGIIRGNGTTTWTTGVSAPTILPFVTCLAIDPVTPGTMYAGTSAGVITSTDGGVDWTTINAGLTSSTVLALAIDPVTPGTLYAGTSGGGVFVSTNRGATWVQIINGLFHLNVTSLGIDKSNHNLVYAGTEGGGVFANLR